MRNVNTQTHRFKKNLKLISKTFILIINLPHLEQSGSCENFNNFF